MRIHLAVLEPIELVRPPALAPYRLDSVGAAADPDTEALHLFRHEDFEEPVRERQDVAGRVAKAAQTHVVPSAVDVDAQPRRRFLKLSLYLSVAEPQKVPRQGRPPFCRSLLS